MLFFWRRMKSANSTSIRSQTSKYFQRYVNGHYWDFYYCGYLVGLFLLWAIRGHALFRLGVIRNHLLFLLWAIRGRVLFLLGPLGHILFLLWAIGDNLLFLYGAIRGQLSFLLWVTVSQILSQNLNNNSAFRQRNLNILLNKIKITMEEILRQLSDDLWASNGRQLPLKTSNQNLATNSNVHNRWRQGQDIYSVISVQIPVLVWRILYSQFTSSFQFWFIRIQILFRIDIASAERRSLCV